MLRGICWRQPGDVGDDLRPQVVLRPAADRHHAADRQARGLERLEVVAHPVGGGLERGAVQVAAGVGERQPCHHAAGRRIRDGGAFAGEVGEHHQAVRPGLALPGFGDQVRELLLAGEFAQPAGDGAGGRHPARQAEGALGEAGGGPQGAAGDRLVGGGDQEGGGAVHQHQIARAGGADADRLGPGVDGPADHRDARRQARHLAGDLRAHGAGGVAGPAQSGQLETRGGAHGPVGVPVLVAAGCTAAGTGWR